MTKRKLLANANGKVRELIAVDLLRFNPGAKVLSPQLLKSMGVKPRGPENASTKQATTIPLHLRRWRPSRPQGWARKNA